MKLLGPHPHTAALVLLLAACGAPESADEAQSPSQTAARGAPGARFDNGRERKGDLEPLPETEITGQDADRDHIRDDVATFIDDRYGDDERKRLAARQFARALQHGLVNGGDKERAIEAVHENMRASRCLFEHTDGDTAGEIISELEARTVDSEARLAAYFVLNGNVSGAYFPDVRDPNAGCRFDTDGLAP